MLSNILLVLFWLFPLIFINFTNDYLQLGYFSISLIIIMWIFNIFILSMGILRIFKLELNDNNYLFDLILNYFLNIIIFLFYFNFESIYYTLISITISIILNVRLFRLTKKLDTKSSKFMIPYLVFNIYLFLTALYLFFYYL